jgi:hypothetical protein
VTTLLAGVKPTGWSLRAGKKRFRAAVYNERKLDKQLHINGPLTTCVATVTATLHEIEASIAIQNEGFENLIRGSKLTMDEVLRRAPGNWYIEANEAKSLGLVAEVL